MQSSRGSTEGCMRYTTTVLAAGSCNKACGVFPCCAEVCLAVVALQLGGPIGVLGLLLFRALEFGVFLFTIALRVSKVLGVSADHTSSAAGNSGSSHRWDVAGPAFAQSPAGFVQQQQHHQQTSLARAAAWSATCTCSLLGHRRHHPSAVSTPLPPRHWLDRQPAQDSHVRAVDLSH